MDTAVRHGVSSLLILSVRVHHHASRMYVSHMAWIGVSALYVSHIERCCTVRVAYGAVLHCTCRIYIYISYYISFRAIRENIA